jgi:hypothetical protein
MNEPIKIVQSTVLTMRSYDIHLLADGGISSEHVSVLEHGLVGGRVTADLQHTAPLGKSCTVLLVLGASRIESVKSYAFINTQADWVYCRKLGIKVRVGVRLFK